MILSIFKSLMAYNDDQRQFIEGGLRKGLQQLNENPDGYLLVARDERGTPPLNLSALTVCRIISWRV